MSDFAENVVCRGAGIPVPQQAVPAVQPESLPMAVETHVAAPARGPWPATVRPAAVVPRRTETAQRDLLPTAPVSHVQPPEQPVIHVVRSEPPSEPAAAEIRVETVVQPLIETVPGPEPLVPAQFTVGPHEIRPAATEAHRPVVVARREPAPAPEPPVVEVHIGSIEVRAAPAPAPQPPPVPRAAPPGGFDAYRSLRTYRRP